MKSNYKKGSKGAEDEKDAMIFKIGAIVVYVLVFFANYVFPTILKSEMLEAGTGWHVVSIIGYIVSLAAVLFGETVAEWFGERVSGAGVTIASVFILGFSIAASAGFSF